MWNFDMNGRPHLDTERQYNLTLVDPSTQDAIKLKTQRPYEPSKYLGVWGLAALSNSKQANILTQKVTILLRFVTRMLTNQGRCCPLVQDCILPKNSIPLTVNLDERRRVQKSGFTSSDNTVEHDEPPTDLPTCTTFWTKGGLLHGPSLTSCDPEHQKDNETDEPPATRHATGQENGDLPELAPNINRIRISITRRKKRGKTRSLPMDG